MKLFEFPVYHGIKIILPLNTKLTYVIGDSGTGKTYLYSALHALKLGGALDGVALLDATTLVHYCTASDTLLSAFLTELTTENALLVMDRLEFLPKDMTDRIFSWLHRIEPSCYILVMDRLGFHMTARNESKMEVCRKQVGHEVILTLKQARGICSWGG